MERPPPPPRVLGPRETWKASATRHWDEVLPCETPRAQPGGVHKPPRTFARFLGLTLQTSGPRIEPGAVHPGQASPNPFTRWTSSGRLQTSP